MGVTRSGKLAASALESLLVAAIIFVALFGVLRPVVGPAGLGWGSGPVFGGAPTVEATLDVQAVNITTDPVLPSLADQTIAAGDGLEFRVPTGTSIVVSEPDLAQRVAFAGNEAFIGLLTVAVLFMLLQITRTLRQGDPFVGTNARRLYVIAGLVGLGGQVAVFVGNWGRLGVMRHPDVAPYVLIGAETTFLPLLAGLGIAVAAEIFRQGAQLRAEVEGLV